MEVKNGYMAIINPVATSKKSIIKLSAEEEAMRTEKEFFKLFKVELADVSPEAETAGFKKGDFVHVNLDRMYAAPRCTVDDKEYLFVRHQDVIFIY